MSDQALRDIISASNPVGYYPLSNILNLGNDISSYANHGSQSGTFTQYIAQFFGLDITMTKGLSSALVVIPDRAEYRGSTITIESIIAFCGDNNLVIFERGGDNKNWSLQTMTTSAGSWVPQVFQFVVGSQGSIQYSRIGNINHIAHIIFSSVNGVDKFYVNGELVYSPGIASGSGIQGSQSNTPLNIFSRNGAYGFDGYISHVAIFNRELTAAEIIARKNLFQSSINKKIAAQQTPVWANHETRLQAWPGENNYKALGSQTAKKSYGVNTAATLNSPPLRKDFGFIEGVITRKTVPAVGQHVICLDDRFNLVAETLSGAGGYYRFDSLPINGLYAIHAYDNNEYKYAPVGADRRTPEAYS